jgi:glycosyltransferase involved in cell wall biosynthesis
MAAAPVREAATGVRGVLAGPGGPERGMTSEEKGALPGQGPTEVALLTGGWDRPYAFGLTTALDAKGVHVDAIVGPDLDNGEFDNAPNVSVFNLRKEQRLGAPFLTKAMGILLYYARLIGYAWRAKPKLFHILWNNRFQAVDRTLLMFYYRLLGKKIVLTAHNVNAGERDSTDSLFNRLTLKCQYRMADHTFVHTDAMKAALVAEFGVQPSAVTVIPFGINNAVPHTPLTPADARRRLGIASDEKTILFFGNIAPYKGLEYLIEAFRRVSTDRDGFHLIVAGRPKKDFEGYWESLRARLDEPMGKGKVTLRIEYIPDADTEVYFKAADLLALPYTRIFQSGVLFLGYSFGLPVLAADVGSLKDEVLEGTTGFVFAPEDPVALANGIMTYFSSDLFDQLDHRRQTIRQHANARYSWDAVADKTTSVYAAVLAGHRTALVCNPAVEVSGRSDAVDSRS